MSISKSILNYLHLIILIFVIFFLNTKGCKVTVSIMSTHFGGNGCFKTWSSFKAHIHVDLWYTAIYISCTLVTGHDLLVLIDWLLVVRCKYNIKISF